MRIEIGIFDKRETKQNTWIFKNGRAPRTKAFEQFVNFVARR
jgi:hypothetical protein